MSLIACESIHQGHERFSDDSRGRQEIFICLAALLCQQSGAPNDRFLSNAFKRCFRLSVVLLKLCSLILGCAKKILSVRLF